MPLEDFFNMLNDMPIEPYIVTLEYKYDHEDTYTIENQILDVDVSGDYVWLNDWNEGQEDVKVFGFIALSNVLTRPIVKLMEGKDEIF